MDLTAQTLGCVEARESKGNKEDGPCSYPGSAAVFDFAAMLDASFPPAMLFSPCANARDDQLFIKAVLYLMNGAQITKRRGVKQSGGASYCSFKGMTEWIFIFSMSAPPLLHRTKAIKKADERFVDNIWTVEQTQRSWRYWKARRWTIPLRSVDQTAQLRRSIRKGRGSSLLKPREQSLNIITVSEAISRNSKRAQEVESATEKLDRATGVRLPMSCADLLVSEHKQDVKLVQVSKRALLDATWRPLNSVVDQRLEPCCGIRQAQGIDHLTSNSLPGTEPHSELLQKEASEK
jgi:hypothetical protein